MPQWISRKKSWLLHISFIIASLLLLIYMGEIYLLPDETSRKISTDISSVIANLFAVIGLVFAAIQSRDESERSGLAWTILAIAQFSYFLGDLFWAILEVGYQIAPFPSIADAFYLAYYPLFLISLILMSEKAQTWQIWVRKSLDSLMVMIASLLLFWNFIIGPYAVQNADLPWLSQVLSLAYPVGDLLILWGLLVLLYNYAEYTQEGHPPFSLMWLSISGIVIIVADFAFSIQSLTESYVSGGLVDLGWTIAYLCIGLAGIRQATSLQSDSKKSKSFVPVDQATSIHKKFANALPYVALICAFALLILRYQLEMPMDFYTVAIWVALLIGIVLARQMMMLAENQRLVSQLHMAFERVKQQTAALERSNQELQEEVTERKRMERQLAHDALHDSLTGLPNRDLFLDRLEHAIAYGKRHPENPFAVLFLDLDHFKVVNDSLGHAAGDELLVAISRRLDENLRDSDTIARFGGDEFVVLLEDVRNEETLIQITEQIQDLLRVPFVLNGRTVFTSASIGVVSKTTLYTTSEDILRDADIAMYNAKAKGKACYTIFNPELGTQALIRLEIENELHRAIEQKEFLLYYQPIYNLSTGRLSGFEALIRWRHPKLGILLPDMFIQVAEETGLILPIGDWVLHEACMQMHYWHSLSPENRKLTVSVNISSKQFAQPDFVDGVAKALLETGIDPSTLKLEITENVIILNPNLANEAFARLSRLGIQLQIDDFGTGYSSLSYLQQFPFHFIKIDRSFIQTMSRSRKNTNLVRTMIRMAHDLGMEAVAEGIETEDQKSFLQGLDCQFGQGFLMSRPLDPQSSERLIQSAVWVEV